MMIKKWQDIYDCFGEYISLRGACESKPQTGLYWNDLHGITLKKAALTANEEDVSGVNLFKRIEQLAIRQTVTKVLSKIAEKYDINLPLSVEQHGVLGNDFLQKQKKHIGKEIIVRHKDPFLNVKIDYVEFWAKGSGRVSVFIEDGDNVIEKKTRFRNGVNRVHLDYIPKSTCPVVYMPICNIEISDGTPCKHYCACYHQHSCDCGNKSYYVHNVSKDLQEENWTYDNCAKGLVLSVSEICDISRLICSIRHLFAEAIWYKGGVLFIDEVMTTDRANRFVRNSTEQLARLKTEWDGGTDPDTLEKKAGQYNMALSVAMKQVYKYIENSSSDCFRCSDKLIFSSLIP